MLFFRSIVLTMSCALVLMAAGKDELSQYTAQERVALQAAPRALEALEQGGYVMYEGPDGVIRGIESRGEHRQGDRREATGMACAWHEMPDGNLYINYNTGDLPSNVRSMALTAFWRWANFFPNLIAGEQGETGAWKTMEITWEPIPGSVVGYGYYPGSCCAEPLAGDIIIDSTHDFDPPGELFHVLYHEMGHAWGLLHNGVQWYSIMWPYLHEYCPVTLADQEGLWSRYNPFRPGPEVWGCAF